MISADLIETARRTRIEDILERYGVRLRGKIDRCGPCPICGGKDRFSIHVGKQVFNCRQCGARGDVIGLPQFLDDCDFATAIETLTDERAHEREIKHPAPERPRDDDEQNKRIAAAILKGAGPLRGTPGEAYLRTIREIDIDAIVDVLERVDAIGWNPHVYFNKPGHHLDGKYLGAIIATMTDPVTAKPTGAISRTYLAPDGSKVGKAKTLGTPRGIVRLSLDEDVLEGLFLAEGIETALTGMANFDFRPIWATGDRMLMADFPVLSGIEALTVIADNDKSGDGEKAARDAEARWLAAGREVRVFLPESGDLNDALRGLRA
jgi:phage/plasmid primase-like uncharacterized protein